MIRFSVLYPKTDGATFDHDYYVNKHVPLAVQTWSPKVTEIDQGVDGPYEAAVHFVFDSTSALSAALSNPRTGELMADLANYTTIQPVTQTSSIVS